MKKVFLCLLLTFAFFASCQKQPPVNGWVTPSNDEPKQEEWTDGSGVRWCYELTPHSKPYIKQFLSDWTTVVYNTYGAQQEIDPYRFGVQSRYWSADDAPPTREKLGCFSYASAYIPENYVELWAPDLVLPAEPYSTVTFRGTVYISDIAFHETVYDFVEENSTEEKDFLIRFAKGHQLEREKGTFDSPAARDEAVLAWCRGFLSDVETVENVGFVRWTGTREELLSMATVSGHKLWVCFPEDFEDIFGVCVEQAQILIENGYFNMWSSPVEGSAMYDLSGPEIQAYLTAHPELLEE